MLHLTNKTTDNLTLFMAIQNPVTFFRNKRKPSQTSWIQLSSSREALVAKPRITYGTPIFKLPQVFKFFNDQKNISLGLTTEYFPPFVIVSEPAFPFRFLGTN